MLPESVSEHYLAQQRLIVATLGLTRQEWASVSLADVDATWAKAAPRINLLTASAQLGAATNGAAYIGSTLDELGYTGRALGAVDPRAFAGFASDGRGLSSLLDGAAIRAKEAQSLEAGGKWLDMAVHTQIADAGRQAAAVGIAAHPNVGWVRMVNPPCCAKCAVLAGKEFRYNQGFQRHPRCDCVHVPTIHGDIPSGLTREPALDQIHGLSLGERQALENGGDLSRVVNARRGASGMHTTELAKRGTARLTPDGILATAKSREEALDLLRRNGYITDTGTRVTRVIPKVPAEIAPQPPKFDSRWLEGRDVHVRKVPNEPGRRALADDWRGTVNRYERERELFAANIEERKQFILKEGLSSRQVTAIMNKQPDVQRWRAAIDEIDDALTTARRQLDDIERDLANVNLPDFDPENPLKFYGDRVKFYSKGDEAANIASDLEMFPEEMHKVLRSHFAEVDGSGFRLGADLLTDIDELSHLRGVAGRGTGAKTFDSDGILGVYDPSKRVCGCIKKHAITGEDHSSTVLHEATHAIDDALTADGLGSPSSSAEFREIWDEMDDRVALWPYITRAGNPEGYLSEGFAESYSRFIHLRRSNVALEGDELVGAFFDTLTSNATRAPKRLDATRRLVSWFEDLERRAGIQATA